jgi:hypothetical protein
VKCGNITDRSILALAKQKQVGHNGPVAPSSLERVHLSYCTNLTLAVSLWKWEGSNWSGLTRIRGFMLY